MATSGSFEAPAAAVAGDVRYLTKTISDAGLAGAFFQYRC
jgi:hypothetical protein